MMTADLATYGARTTPFPRAAWLDALARIPAEHDLDEIAVDAIAKLATATNMTPTRAVLGLWPDNS